MVHMKTVSLHSFYKRKRDESDVGEEEDQAPPILQLGDLEPQRQEGNEEEATQLDELDQLRQGEQEAAVENELDDSEPQRGRDETPQSKNRGNFIEMLKLLAEFNPKIANVILENAPKYCKYTSPDIQKEILSIFAMKVRKHIREEIGDAKFYILMDETCDVAKREQMALVFRFVDINGVLQERFFDLIHKHTFCVVAVLVVNLNILLRSATIEWRYFVQPLIPNFQTKEICRMIEKYYPLDFNQQEMIGLELSTATAERIFSVLKIVKTRLRNKIEDQYLANSLLVQVEGEIVEHYTYDDIISDFKDMKNRRADF
ncbi:uncharacterized protein [Miscanthus floridulus]|uniref:uncharacterized protein n=1 Tax=Miscanthus floridulus TaxID=154761 RepID=UPI00345A5DBF